MLLVAAAFQKLSALSQTLRQLEERLGLRLLMRTMRSVAPTEAGERLLRSVGPRLKEIEAELEALSALRGKPAGTVRITVATMRPEPFSGQNWPLPARISGY